MYGWGMHRLRSNIRCCITQLAQDPLNICFRRGFNDHKWNEFCTRQHLMSANLSNESDRFVWKLTDSGDFMVKFYYLDLMNGHTRFLREYLWKLTIPLKNKMFM
jgi:hypothetical protein